MSVVFIVAIDVTDFAAYQEYLVGARPLVEAAGGKYLAKTGEIVVLEGDFVPNRLAIIEWPSAEQADAFYNSAEYAPMKAIRQRSAKTEFWTVPVA